ncbi:DNA alkylation repair protein [Methylophaga sp.]|uniref:DNA alkylation repair protein n=1 Tax=Methylophaga sp. TaxID=2024840 RepID=UPI003F69E7A9
MTEQALLKNQLGDAAISELRQRISAVYPEFDGQAFEIKALSGLTQLELKARVSHLILALSAYLPDDFCETARILEPLADNWLAESKQRNWTSYIAWPVIDYVSVHGLAYPQRAFALLEKLTPLFTAEFAIRAFLNQHFDLTYQQMLRWTEHDNEHVRRLASEGLRPRLPWAAQLQLLRADPTPLWPLLEQLKADTSLYVRRSVANNLNDISKDHPDQVLAVCEKWRQADDNKTDWVIRHGLRGLVKAGEKGVYPLLGYSEMPELLNVSLSLDMAELTVGETLGINLTFESAKTQSLVLDYRISFVRADGKLSKKVFKWKNIHLETQERVCFRKAHSFKAITTRRYYPGTHYIDVLVNGETLARAAFDLAKV